MKKSFLVTCLAVVAIFLITGCGKESGSLSKNSKSISYKEYEVKSLKLELPDSWKVEQESDGSLKTTNLGDTVFSIYISNVPEKQFKYFGETYMVNLIEEMEYTDVDSYELKEYSSYKAYDYKAETVIKGEKSPVKVTALSVDGSAVVLMLVCADNNYNYEAIYNHILDSIK